MLAAPGYRSGISAHSCANISCCAAGTIRYQHHWCAELLRWLPDGPKNIDELRKTRLLMKIKNQVLHPEGVGLAFLGVKWGFIPEDIFPEIPGLQR